MVPQQKNGEVRTWLIFVADALPCYDALFHLLTPEEQQRANRYLPADARHEFVIGRACLRLLLAKFPGSDPRRIVFAVGSHGKLHVEGLHFNLSHSHGLIAIAVSATSPVGIDIEHEDRAVEVLEVAEAIFDASQLADLRSATEEDRRRLFFDLWTAEEARAKCLGLGLADLEEVRRQRDRLHVRHVALPVGYLGALCTVLPVEAFAAEILTAEAIATLLHGRYVP